jgi:flagellar P-ring protein FlgI
LINGKEIMSARISIVFVFVLIVAVDAVANGLKLGDICRVKGQEVNTLQGLGLVVGLRGTGDSDAAPTARALARMMQLMGGQVALDSAGALNLRDIKDAKNVALVFVTVKVPAVGAQQGDLLDVSVNAISAKSLDGGYLMLTPLLGPRADNPKVFALAQGALSVSMDGPPTNARIQGGCKMESTITAEFHENGLLTLVLDRDFADFDTAQRVEDEINNLPGLTLGDSTASGVTSSQRRTRARAMDQLHIEVSIPELYQPNPIKFVSYLLNIPIQLSNRSSRVVINERDGIVVIGEDVEIAPVLITHRNLRIEAGGKNLDSFVPIGQQPLEANASLKALADALNALDVSTDDLIAIIKTLKKKGDLYGEVVFE